MRAWSPRRSGSTSSPTEGAVHKNYQEYHAQLLELHVRNVVFERQRMVMPDGVADSFNLDLHRFVLAPYHQAQSTIGCIADLLNALGLDISTSQVRRILTDNREAFIDEGAEILREGLEGAAWVSVDDTGARGACLPE